MVESGPLVKAIAKCADPRPMVKAMKSYPKAKGLNTKDCALEETKLFVATQRKLDLPLGAGYDSHWLDKVNYSIPCSNTRVKKRHAYRSPWIMQRMMWHISHQWWRWTALMLVAYCKVATQFYQKMLSKCKPLHRLCAILKWDLPNMPPLLQRTKRQRSSSLSPPMWRMGFGFAMMASSVVWVTTKMNMLWIGLYTLTSIMSPLSIEHLDIVTQNFETKFSSVKLPRYYPYHPW